MQEQQAVPQAATPTPTAGKPRNHRGLIKNIHEKAVSRTEKVLAACQNPAYTAILAKRDIDAAFLAGLAGDCQAARNIMGQAVNDRTDKVGATSIESMAKKALLTLVREAQYAARQKHGLKNRVALQDYYIGQPVSRNRAKLEQAATAILKKITAEPLPGIAAESLAAALKAYQDADTAQSSARSAAIGSLTALGKLIDRINLARQRILCAVESAWPPGNPDNASARSAFELLPNRRCVG